MHGSKALSAFLSLLVIGALTGCSQENQSFTSPGDGVPAWGTDDTAPAMPTGLRMEKATPQAFRLGWTPNTEVDLAGYRVYVYDPSPYRDGAYNCPHGVTLIDKNTNWYFYSDNTGPGPHFFKLSAVDEAGNESARCAPFAFSLDGNNGDTVSEDVATDDAQFVPTHGWDDEPITKGNSVYNQN